MTVSSLSVYYYLHQFSGLWGWLGHRSKKHPSNYKGHYIMHDGRRFIRHPTDIPIDIQYAALPPVSHQALHNVSLGGLAFKSLAAWEVGSVVTLRIPLVKPPFESIGQVVWCRTYEAAYYVGVEFIEQNDVFKARMVEQVCQIERYRRMLEKEGRKITIEEAAMEWIQRYAADFPTTGNNF